MNTPPSTDIVYVDRMISLLIEDIPTGRYGATPELLRKWQEHRVKLLESFTGTDGTR
jgi:hypothetical protein